MADYDSSLPIRSEADGNDERVHVKIVDKDNPDTQQATVDTDSNMHVEGHGNDPSGVDRVIRTSEQGHTAVSGIYDVADNTDPSNIALIAHVRDATPGDTQSTERLTSIEDSGGTVRALDISLHDEAGEPYSLSNPLPVSLTESEGDEIVDFNETAAVAAGASTNHDYTVTAAKTLLAEGLFASGSGKLKVVLAVEDGPGAGTFTTKFVGFNSTSSPNVSIPLGRRLKVAAGVIIRITISNRDNQAQDLYSTLSGIEI